MTTKQHRKAGSAGANQYGEYKVRYASSRQVLFIKNLLDMKQHSLTEPDWENLNVQGAGELITALLKLPNREDRKRFISEKQESFLLHLVEIKEGGAELLKASLLKESVKDVASLSADTAKEVINNLIYAPLKPKPVQITQAGAYRVDDQVFSIRIGRQSGRWQVFSLDSASNRWVYDSKNYKILFKVKPENRLTLNEAIAISATTGSCVHCGRTLTLASSVVKGMGRVCEKQYERKPV